MGKRLKLSTYEIDAIAFCCNRHMKRWDVSKPSLVAEMVLSPHYDMLRHVTSCDESGRLYASNYNKRVLRDRKLQAIRSDYVDKKSFDERVAKFVDGNKIMSLRPGIKGSDIGKVKNAAVEYVVNNGFMMPQDVVDNFIIDYDLGDG